MSVMRLELNGYKKCDIQQLYINKQISNEMQTQNQIVKIYLLFEYL